MAKAFEIKGFKEFQDKLAKAGKLLPILADAEASAAAQSIASAARSKAPDNIGALRASIQPSGSNGKYSITASVNYAAYVEFGTKSKVKVPASLSEYASQFRGKTGGTFDQLFLAILEWVKKKGLGGRYSVKTQRRLGTANEQIYEDYDIAFNIAVSIARNGIKAQPFLFPSVDEEQPKFFERVKNILSNL